MQVNHMRKLIGILGLATAALLSACGGGGGSSGDTQEQYSITLRAEKTSLPTNISMLPPGMGVYAPYTTTLYVNAKEGNDAILSGENVFSCNLEGLSSGALYYLDGDSEHEDEDGNPNAYRSVTLGASAGGASFHFHARNQAGTAHITCSVVDPRDNRVYSASVDIKVGSASGTVGSIRMLTYAPQYLGTQTNLWNLSASVVLQARVLDDANQPVPNANLQVSLLTSAASLGASLSSGTSSGSNLQNIQVRADGNGIAQFRLSSGWDPGVIALKVEADRYDNNLSNGIQDPVRQYFAIQVVRGVGETPLAFDAISIPATNAVPMAYTLEASGGVPPYTWAALGTLPEGLLLDPQSSIIQGTPQIKAGTYIVQVRVTDANRVSVTKPVTFNISNLSNPVMVVNDAGIGASAGVPLFYALSATGGRPPLKWLASTLPPGLDLSPEGVLSGSVKTAGVYPIAVTITDADGTSASGNVTLTVTGNEN
jgi:hypothetical protein